MMQKKERNPMVGVRLSARDNAKLLAFAEERGCSLSEAIRLALSLGIPLAMTSTSVDIQRALSLLEFAGASLGVIIRANHSDHEETVKQMVIERMERYHG